MNRIEKEIANKQSQLEEVKQKNERLKDEVDKDQLRFIRLS